jgi:hypothetical protein
LQFVNKASNKSATGKPPMFEGYKPMLECYFGKYSIALTTNRQHLPLGRQAGGNFMPLCFYDYLLNLNGYLNTQKIDV